MNIFSFRYCTIWKTQRKCHRVIEILSVFTILSKMGELIGKAKGSDSHFWIHHWILNENPVESKNRLTFDQWPAGYFFPTYCGGPCKLVSSNALLKITSVINKSLAEKFPLEDVLFSGIFRTIANVTNIQHKRGLCEHADRAYEDPAKHLFAGLLNIYFSQDFEIPSSKTLKSKSQFIIVPTCPQWAREWVKLNSIFEIRFSGGLKQMQV